MSFLPGKAPGHRARGHQLREYGGFATGCLILPVELEILACSRFLFLFWGLLVGPVMRYGRFCPVFGGDLC